MGGWAGAWNGNGNGNRCARNSELRSHLEKHREDLDSCRQINVHLKNQAIYFATVP
jgi:hypothetical protein